MIRRPAVLFAVCASTLSACVTTRYSTELPLSVSLPPGHPGAPASRVEVDEHEGQVRIVAGPFTIPGAMAGGGAASDHGDHGDHGGHGAGMKTPLVPVVWPVDGGLRGFRLALFKGDGTPLSRAYIHHLNALHFDRRELLYPVPTRLIAIGSETPDIRLPGSHQVYMQKGDSLGWYIMWHNEEERAIDDVYVQFVLPYGAPPDEEDPVYTTIYMDTNLVIGEETSFDVPPGRSETSYLFRPPTGGRLVGAGGHVHDYGVEVRLEDAESGEVMFRLEAVRDADGMVSSVEQKIFRRLFGLLDASVELRANHPYRVVGVYENPTGRTIPKGGMAQIGGLFRPTDIDAWPSHDPHDPAYRLDLSGLPDALPVSPDAPRSGGGPAAHRPGS